jgi:hypothetical protein
VDPEELLEMVRTWPKRVLLYPLGRWQILMVLPFVGLVMGVSLRSIEVQAFSAPLVATVVSFYAMRLVLLNGGDTFLVMFAGFTGFVVVSMAALALMFGKSRPWTIENADRIARQDVLLQVCLEQRLDASCTTPECRADSHEEVRRACLDDWLAGCHVLGTNPQELEAMARETRQHLDTLCTYFQAR